MNDTLQTSDANIYAIGESALHGGMVYGLVAPGYDMADTVVTNLLGGEKTFTGFDMSTKLKLIGVDVASFGDAFANPATSRSIVFENKAKGIYKRINISEYGKYLVGGILVGDAGNYNMLLQTVQNKIILPQDPEDLILGSRGGSSESAGTGIMSLPDEALICSCENVSKGDICSSVTDGTCTYACEWKEVVNNPELRQRFQHFINTPEPDPSIRFKPERGQKVPVV